MTYGNLKSWLRRDLDLFDPSHFPCERCLCEDWDAKLNEEVWLCELVNLVIQERRMGDTKFKVMICMLSQSLTRRKQSLTSLVFRFYLADMLLLS